jgi:adenine deaminase
VINGDEGVLDKLDLFQDRVLDGHSPAVRGKPLNAYVAAGIGSDHECTTVDEALEKLRLGLTIFIREGTTTHNLRPLLPLIKPENYSRICFCTDDRVPADLLDRGSIDDMVRIAIANGIDPITAIRLGTINTANYFRLRHLGAVAPGRRADLIVFSDLNDLRAEQVYRGGVLVAENGRVTAPKPPLRPIDLRASMNVAPGDIDLRIPAANVRGAGRIRVIGGTDTQVVTPSLVEDATIVDGEVVADPNRDILKIVVVERHRATGNVGKAFIKGFGLKRGALAGSVAHDHHNLVVIGADDASIRAAINAVIDMGGGLTAVDGDKVLASLALSVAGLMSEAPIDEVRRQYDALIAAAQGLGSTMRDPFMAMSFMALEVIPYLKLTDIGLVDVERFEVVDVFVE